MVFVYLIFIPNEENESRATDLDKGTEIVTQQNKSNILLAE